MNTTDDVEFRLILKDEFSKAMGQFRDELKHNDKGVEQSNSILRELKGTIVSVFGVYELINFGKEIIETTAKFQGLDNMIKFSSKDAADYATNQAFLTKEIKDLSLPMEEAKAGFAEMAAGMYGTGIEGEKLRNLFDGISTAVATLHLSADSFHNVTFALKEIGELGTVQARQMRMLAFALPGAMNLAAQSMGMSTEQFHEAMKKGAVNSAEFLQKFSVAVKQHFQSGVGAFKDSMIGQMNAMKNSITQTMLGIGSFFEPIIIKAMKGVQELISLLQDSGLGGAFKDLLPVIGQIFHQLMSIAKIVLPPILSLISPLVTIFKVLIGQVLAFIDPVVNALKPALQAINIIVGIIARYFAFFVPITTLIAKIFGGWVGFLLKIVGQVILLIAKMLEWISHLKIVKTIFEAIKWVIEKIVSSINWMAEKLSALGKFLGLSSQANATSTDPAQQLKEVSASITGGGESGALGGGKAENQSDKVTGQKSVTINVVIQKMTGIEKLVTTHLQEGANAAGEALVKTMTAAINQYSASVDV